MSAILSTVGRPAFASKPSAFARAIETCRAVVARRLARRAAIERLRDLDDRALRDIGLDRTEIEAAVRGLSTTAGKWR